MLNKKAIAAFAAGATLLSGMAFAAPAFAAEPAKKPTAEQCKNAKDAVEAKKADLQDAKDDLVTANAAKRRAHKKLDDAKAAVTAYKNAVQKFTDAKSAIDDADQSDGVAVAQAKKNADEAAKAVKDAIDAAEKTDVKLEGAKPVAPQDNTSAAPDKKAYDAKLKNIKTDAEDKAVSDAQDAVSAAQDKLDLAEIHLKNLGCAVSGGEDPNPNPGPTPTPTPKGKDVQHTLIDKVRFAKMMLDDADDALAHAKATLKDKTAALAAATAELKARTNDLDNAKLRLNEFLASGVNDSATQTRLSDAVDRAEAHVLRATAAFAKANGEYKDALAKAFAAVDAYNKALLDYKAIYNEAVANGVNPALLPPVVTSDPLSKDFPQVPGAKALYDSALSGKFGQEVKKILEETCGKACAPKKSEAKKCADKAAPLAKTGAAVALAAVAASVLAGMGAALRKIRH